MKAVVINKYGPPEVFEAAEIRKPEPRSNEILIKVLASTVTSADCMMRRGDTFLSRILLGLFRPAPKYRILGTEFAGIVEQVGTKVKKFRVGNEIFAFRGFGTGCYAQYKCMNENGSIAVKPFNMSFTEAASVVDGASTALFFLVDKANICQGQKVLINGASGSIGTFAVQLARYSGCDVTAVCGPKNIEIVRSLGADRVIDYTKEDFTQSAFKYDIIFDTVGKSSFKKCKGSLTQKGKYISTVMNYSNLLRSLTGRFSNGKRVIWGMSLNKTVALNYLRPLFEDKSLITIIDRSYHLDDIKEAHEYVEKGHKTGNVVISITK